MNDLELKIKGKVPGQDTGIEVRKSVCAICDPGTQCGLDLYIKDGEIKAIFDIDSDRLDGLKDDVSALREIGSLLGELLNDF